MANLFLILASGGPFAIIYALLFHRTEPHKFKHKDGTISTKIPYGLKPWDL